MHKDGICSLMSLNESPEACRLLVKISSVSNYNLSLSGGHEMRLFYKQEPYSSECKRNGIKYVLAAVCSLDSCVR